MGLVLRIRDYSKAHFLCHVRWPETRAVVSRNDSTSILDREIKGCIIKGCAIFSSDLLHDRVEIYKRDIVQPGVQFTLGMINMTL